MKEVDDEDNNNDINTNKINNYYIKNLDSNKRIIMECNKEFLTFNKKNYPSILEDYISKNEWETIANEANLVIGNAYHLKKMEETVRIPQHMNVIFFLSFFFCLFDSIFLIIYTKKEDAHDIMFYIAVSLVLFSC